MNFNKAIPTDMDWHPTFIGGYVMVSLSILDKNFFVTIRGADDTMLGRIFDTEEQAVACYNSLKYIQSDADLKCFLPAAPGRDNSNGRPRNRCILPEPDCFPYRERDFSASEIFYNLTTDMSFSLRHIYMDEEMCDKCGYFRHDICRCHILQVRK